ncbi:glucosamine 6-phosphate synthetase [Ureibacillus sp. MALMAid1270]|uniref:glucosamine 6-phosphate synthetase n=1 Tax=Ureibacillus sp. MALMAid1270 TaxID=3411629 RepID=UPI003BA75C0E
MQNVSKRTILWIVPILIIVIFWFVYGPKEEITDNEYITYIKQEKINENAKTYEEAFASSCEEGKWIYFKTQKEQHVVEFEGTCPHSETMKKVNLQFIIEDDRSDYDLNVLLLDSVQQTSEIRDQFIDQVVSL